MALDQHLANNYSLYPFNSYGKGRGEDLYSVLQPRFSLGPQSELTRALRDWHTAVHDDRITSQFPFEVASGTRYDDITGRHGLPLKEVIRELVPQWNGIIKK